MTDPLPGLPAGGQSRVPLWDALRGWAALAVVAVHFSQMLPDPQVEAACSFGQYGVQLFYLASAYTLSLSLSRRTGDGKWSSYVTRRFFRIAPLFFVILTVAVLIHGRKPSPFAPYGSSVLSIIGTYLFANGWHPQTINALVAGGWSIAVETNFYLVLPAMLLVATSLQRSVYLLLGICLFALAADSVVGPWLLTGCDPKLVMVNTAFLYLWLPSQMPVFALGIVLFHLLHAQDLRLRDRIAWFATAAAGMLALAMSGTDGLQTHWVFAVAATAAVWGLSVRPSVLVVNRFSVFLGVLSYSVYLLHIPILRLAKPGFKPLFLIASPHVGGAVAALLVFALTLLVIVPVAWITWRWIEVPGQELGSRIIDRMKRSRGRPGSASVAS